MEFKEIDYGFKWGPAEITRVCSDEKRGWIILSIKTKKYPYGLQVYITKTGKVRVHSPNGKEWKQ